MKIYSDAALAAFADGSALVTGAVAIECSDPVRVWGGYEDREIGGDTFTGVGDRGLAQVTQGALGGVAQGVTLSLSGVSPEALAMLDAMDLRGAPAVLWRMVFDGSGLTQLAAHVHTRGRVDEVPVADTPGGTSTISVEVEGAARGQGRNGGRMRTDADQRLVSASDGGLKRVAYAKEKQLYWGGQPPATVGSAFGTIFNSVISAKIGHEIG